MTESHYFLREDLDALNESIREVDDRIREILNQAGGSCQEGADTWHDNFEYEDCQRSVAMWSTRLRELVALRKSAKLITPAPTGDEALIGRTITIQDQETKEVITFQIGSYMILKKRADREAVSYAAPLAVMFIGAKVGEIKEGEIGREKKRFMITKIE